MNDIKLKANPFSMQLITEDFLPASADEKKDLIVMRESTTYWKDAMQRFRKNKVAMAAFVVIILVMIYAFIAPSFYPYQYDEQIRGSEDLRPMQYSQMEQQKSRQAKRCFLTYLEPTSLEETLIFAP